MRWLLVLVLLTLFAERGYAEAELRSYQLGSNDPNHVMDAIRPLLGAASKTSVMHDRLLVLAEPREHELIRQTLEILEIRAPQYVVTVIQGASSRQAELLTSGRRALSHNLQAGPDQAWTTSVRVVAGQSVEVRRSDERTAVQSAFKGNRASGFAYEDRAITSGLSLRVHPRGDGAEVRLRSLQGVGEDADLTKRSHRLVHTTIVVPFARWVVVQEQARLEDATGNTGKISTSRAFDGNLTLIKVDNTN